MTQRLPECLSGWGAGFFRFVDFTHRALAGAFVGILCTALLSGWLAPAAAVWLVAPIVASAVLVFTAPASPLAQPWSVVGDILCRLWWPWPLRSWCLHP
jgi:hypothetical protein